MRVLVRVLVLVAAGPEHENENQNENQNGNHNGSPRMARKRERTRGPRYEDPDPEFQRRWLEARSLQEAQVEAAFLHGFEARHRFADRPFSEVVAYLRESWEGMGPVAPWDAVADIVRSGYERDEAASLDYAADLGPEALERFARRTEGGSARGGRRG